MGRKAISEVTKWQIVGLGKDKSKNLRKIAELVGVSEKCVSTTLKNFDISGSVKDKRRPGRPEKITYREKSLISRYFLRQGTKSLRRGDTECYTALKRRRIYSTVRRVLRSKELVSNLAVKKPFLSITDKKKDFSGVRKEKIGHLIDGVR